MIIPGLISVTFRNKIPEEIVNLALNAGLKGIEWGGDIHVPVGDFKQAEKVCRLTMDSGLSVSAYGSYYTVGKSQNEGIDFLDVLETAKSLNAPIIRIWAGDMGSHESTPAYKKQIFDEAIHIADLAGREGISLAFEFHENTLNDTYQASYELFTKLNHPMVKTYWQPIHGAGPDINGAGIDMILPWIIGVHVFHWWPNAEVRLPLKSGIEHWEVYINRLSKITQTIFGSLEFVKENSEKHFFDDASTLLELIGYNKVSKSREIIFGN